MKLKKNSGFGWLIFYAMITLSGCRAHSPSWNGTWKVNASKSSFQADPITISISGDGEYHYSDGVVSTSFLCDGKFRPIDNNRMQNCVKTSPTILDKTRMENGVKTNTYRWELWANGKFFTSTATAFRSAGPVILGRSVASRLSGSNGFEGQWKDEGFLQRHAGFSLKLDSHYLHVEFLNADLSVDAPVNGADAATYGADAIVSKTYAVQTIRPQELLIVGKLHGNEISKELLKLSDDGRTITTSWWNPSRPADKATLVYERQ